MEIGLNSILTLIQSAKIVPPSTFLPHFQLYFLKTPRYSEKTVVKESMFCLYITYRICFSALLGLGVNGLKIMCRCISAQNIFTLFLSPHS